MVVGKDRHDKERYSEEGRDSPTYIWCASVNAPASLHRHLLSQMNQTHEFCEKSRNFS